MTLCVVLCASALLGQSLPPIEINQNHSAAGVLHDGVLTLQLEIAKGKWHPEADGGMAIAVYAFGETGHPLQNPGPLIRVPQGTEIRCSLHNNLSESISVHGLADPGTDSAVHVAPGATEQIRFKATTPGLSLYWGDSGANDLKLRHGIDSELSGALVVDPPGSVAPDEIFVLEMVSEHAGITSRQTLATINGKSWPYTPRFEYKIGQPVHWRWLNATNEPHALHLHGFYYRIDAINRGGQITHYEGDSRPLVVTRRIAQGDTFDMSWSPDRAGKWLFHCHMFQHMIPPIVPDLPGLAVTSAPNDATVTHENNGMGQLILGITVPPDSATPDRVAWHANRKLTLEISERPGAPRYALSLREASHPELAPTKPGLIGPSIILTRGEPVEIEVVNHLKDPTAIHWHGIELESYYDGVPGWSGTATETTPPIPPGGSFVVRITPPRAGSFIYHTHWHDPGQLTNGIYGPLIVLPPGQKFDPASDLTFLFSIGDFGTLKEMALINGTPQSKAMQLQAGRKYRFRFINISTNNQAMQVSLNGLSGPVEWRNIAKDGADLPSEAARPTKAQLTVSVGETYDVEFTAATPQDLLLDLFLPGQKIHTSQTLSFAVASTSAP